MHELEEEEYNQRRAEWGVQIDGVRMSEQMNRAQGDKRRNIQTPSEAPDSDGEHRKREDSAIKTQNKLCIGAGKRVNDRERALTGLRDKQ